MSLNVKILTSVRNYAIMELLKNSGGKSWQREQPKHISRQRSTSL